MDIPRERRSGPDRKRLVLGGAAALAALAITVALTTLDGAAPGVERETITIGTVRMGTMLRQVRGPGTLVPEGIQWVPALTAGRIERKLVEPGTRVEAGTVLLEMSNPDVQLELLEAERRLAEAQAQLVSVETTLETQRLDQAGVVATVHAQRLAAQRDAEAARTLLDRGLIARAEYQTDLEHAEELGIRLRVEEERLAVMTAAIGPQTAVQRSQVARLASIVDFQRKRVASMRVTATSAGVLQDMPLEEGQWVQPGTTLARVVQPERLKAVLKIPETQARDIVLGQPVTIDMRTDSIQGTVARIDPAVQNGTVAVDVALGDSLPPGARPDLSVDGTITVERLESVLHVERPVSAQADQTIGLFRLVEDGAAAERVQVRLGSSSVSTVQVLGGLEAGDRIVTSDMSRFDSHDRVRLE